MTNIGRAARYIDGTLLMPGQTFSMNDTVKERTVENGYTVGTVISGGRFAEELGGGVSTITTTMWHTAFYAGLERVEQRGHSFYISRYLPGLEATVAWGSLDLRFKNDSPYAVLIKASITNSSVTVTMYGTKRYRSRPSSGRATNIRPFKTVYDPSPTCVVQPGVEGFRIVVTRVFHDLDGKVVKREPLTTSYNVADDIHCGSKPKPKPKPSPDHRSPSQAPYRLRSRGVRRARRRSAAGRSRPTSRRRRGGPTLGVLVGAGQQLGAQHRGQRRQDVPAEHLDPGGHSRAGRKAGRSVEVLDEAARKPAGSSRPPAPPVVGNVHGGRARGARRRRRPRPTARPEPGDVAGAALLRDEPAAGAEEGADAVDHGLLVGHPVQGGVGQDGVEGLGQRTLGDEVLGVPRTYVVPGCSSRARATMAASESTPTTSSAGRSAQRPGARSRTRGRGPARRAGRPSRSRSGALGRDEGEVPVVALRVPSHAEVYERVPIAGQIVSYVTRACRQLRRARAIRASRRTVSAVSASRDVDDVGVGVELVGPAEVVTDAGQEPAVLGAQLGGVAGEQQSQLGGPEGRTDPVRVLPRSGC